MQFPADYKYSKEHTWVKVLNNNEASVGITEFAQSELGEIVYVDLPSVGSHFKKDEVFGSVEALKTTSDLFMPISGKIIEVNKAVVTKPELVNTDSYTSGWMIRIGITEPDELNALLDDKDYQTMIG